MENTDEKSLNTLDLLPDSVSVYDKDFNLLYCNPASVNYINDAAIYEEGRLVGTNLFFMVPELNDEELLRHIKNDFSQDNPYVMKDYRLKCPIHNTNLIVENRIAFYEDKLFLISRRLYNVNDGSPADSEAEVQSLKSENEELKIALRVLMDNLDEKVKDTHYNLTSDIKQRIYPIITALQDSSLSPLQAEILNKLTLELCSVLESDHSVLVMKEANLTSKEIQICQLIEMGMTTKDISDLLCVSVKTVNYHRLNIRKKLGLTNNQVSLTTFLYSSKDK